VDVVVVGSLNMDLVVRTARHPLAGETLPGSRLDFFHGGKGANQAVGAVRLGARVAMIGAVGTDSFGQALGSALAAEGIDTAGLRRVDQTGTGTAMITVSDAGENTIVVVPGANLRCDVAWVRQNQALIASAKVLMLQLEVPMAANLEAARVARAQGCQVIFDPAPAPAGPLPPELAALVDHIVPNEREAQALTGIAVDTEAGAREAGGALLAQGYRRAIIKLGGRGALLAGPEGLHLVPGFPVTPVDTTAAGDAFGAGLAVSLVQGYQPLEAVRRANGVGALAVTRNGAQASMPRVEELEQFLSLGGEPR